MRRGGWGHGGSPTSEQLMAPNQGEIGPGQNDLSEPGANFGGAQGGAFGSWEGGHYPPWRKQQKWHAEARSHISGGGK